jgi:hypothetical protein
MSLYFQPSPDGGGTESDNTAAVVTAPETGLDIAALIDRLAARVNNAERKIEHAVSADALARIILTDRDIVLMADQVSILGQLNIADWIRDISGNPTGGIDKSSMTRITGGKIQTGIIESTNWTTTTGSQFNLDNGSLTTGGSIAPKFSVDSLGNLTAQSATIKGQLIAGSVITNTVTVSGSGMSMQDIIDASGGTFDLQGALDAGVADILAGVGSNYRLDVDTANAFVAFRHKDAVYQGTASPGSNKPALGISAAGIAMGYNRSSDGAWVNSVAISAAGNATFLGTVSANSVIANTVTISGGSTTMQDLIDASGSTFDLQGALDAGVTNVLAGIGSNYRLNVDAANALVTFQHKDAVYKGSAAPGSVKTALGISSAGIAMGYNRSSDGAWVDSVSIDASGNPVFSGTIAANSIIVNSATVDGVTFGAIKSNAANGDTAYTGTTDFRTTGAPSNQPIIGAVATTSSSIGTVDIKLTWSYTQGARKAEFFYLYVLEGTTNPTAASPILATVDGSATDLTISGVPMDKSYRVGIVAARKSSLGIEKGAIVNSWVRTGVTGNITANIDGTSPSGVKNSGITLSSNGTLLGAGGGAITALDYGNVSGTKPPPSATENLFTQSSSDPTGGVDGNAHWNTATQVMWFRTSGTWKAGGTVNASQITTGTLAAARIAANSITSDKISVGTISAISANLGTVNAGSITGNANINIAGTAKFQGSTNSAGSFFCGVFNESRSVISGLSATAGSGGIGVVGTAGTNGSSGLVGSGGTSLGATGVLAIQGSGGLALEVSGKMAISSNALVINLNADMLDGLHSSAFLGVSATATNSNSLGGYAPNSWARIFTTPGGTANAAGAGIQFASSVPGVSWSGSGNTVTAISTSDRRLKNNILDEEDGLAFVMRMRPRTYEMRDQPGKRYHGFIAQEIKGIITDVTDCTVINNDNGMLGVDYNGLESIIVKAIQQLNDKIEEMNARINAASGNV